MLKGMMTVVVVVVTTTLMTKMVNFGWTFELAI